MSELQLPSSAADLLRCPGCRSPILDAATRQCPLCGITLDRSLVINDDTTPYAEAQGAGLGKMIRWVLGAGSYRLAHLLRMRRSTHSRRFARWSVLQLAMAGALLTLPFPGNGFRAEFDHGATQLIEPATGRGWQMVGSLERPKNWPEGQPFLARLYWNPAIILSSLAINLVMLFLLGSATLAVWRAGSRRALHLSQREQPYFSAAIDYSTAHWWIVSLAGVCYGLLPLHYIAQLNHSVITWSAMWHIVPASMIGGAGIVLHWFWLVRMAAMAPATSRAGVMRYFGIWAPLTATCLLGGWLIGEYYALPRLIQFLHLSFESS
ncbi:MAG: hypothetical protein HJJLKODD_01164 [Phycisphaerae bacterium]|nr:hypothetical protein [Phycisphaerae bacterium]